MEPHPTDTSRWALVVQRVTTTTAEVWVGTLFPSMAMPERARIRITDAQGVTRVAQISRAQWARPFGKVKQRFYALRKIGKLTPDSHYRVTFDRQVIIDGKKRWQQLRDGRFETLPARVPQTGQRPFTIALATCFYNHRDGGRAAEAYKNLYESAPALRPHIKALAGDQVYLDIGFDSLSPITSELRERIADDYAKHWQSLGSIMTRGGTWMLPDDHEYWNDYPFYDSLIPTLLALKIDAVRSAWTQASRDAVKNVQRSPVVEVVNLGEDLSICFADLRSYRGVHKGKPVMMHPKTFPRLLRWACDLTTPGVLVIPQPLIVEHNPTERNLLSFPEQYGELLTALGHSGHDIVVLSGDVHFGRIASCPLGTNGGKLVEIISSPLSNLTYLNGISTATPKFKPTRFPDAAASFKGWKSQPVTYSRDFAVGTVPGSILSAYPRARTKEHFITVSFNRKQGNKLQLSAQSWLVREPQGKQQLPARGFKKPFTTTLQ